MMPTDIKHSLKFDFEKRIISGKKTKVLVITWQFTKSQKIKRNHLAFATLVHLDVQQYMMNYGKIDEETGQARVEFRILDFYAPGNYGVISIGTTGNLLDSVEKCFLSSGENEPMPTIQLRF
ncbi:hypothetical protein [Crassaminicella profunda]|uniref:hypothetical protein n=1 Tax=Crassaminicella profunda TaxID=1286698 RepID=UPI001CA71999|nr:hypothetical protein [Crassaminicella profunda]QZY55266.1 hypothetical protein K7H06_20065 [Crassaminicella profunda]